MRIVVLEPLGLEDEKVRSIAGKIIGEGHELVTYKDKVEDIDVLKKRASGADILVIANMPLKGEVINSVENLKMISVAFTGVDHVDIKACRERNIAVCNAAGYSTSSVAELTYGLERIAMYLQDVDNVFEIKWNEDITYADIFKKAEYEQELIAQKFQNEGLTAWIEEQRSKATIEILDPAFRAFRLKNEEKWPEAALAYEKAIKKDKDNQGYYLSLKEVYVRDNRLDDAAKLMETARKKWPENLAVLLALADVYALQKDTVKTGEVLAYTSSIGGDDIALHQEIKALYEKAEMTAEAADEQVLIEALVGQQAADQTGADVTGDILADDLSSGLEEDGD